MFERHTDGKFLLVVKTHSDNQISITAASKNMQTLVGSSGIEYLKRLRCKNDKNPQNLIEKLI
jgi:hypothetical protein